MSGAFFPVTTSDQVPAPRSGWRWCLLRDVARLESGHTPSRREPSYWDGGNVPWLSLKDIRGLAGRYVTETEDMPTQAGIDNSSARVLPRGTVAFCRTASVGKVAILGRDMATSQDFANWVCGPELLPEYLYEALRASGGQFDKEKQGTTHKTIYMPVLDRFRVLVPPIPEQCRIADVLDKADAIRRKRKETIALTDELLRSAFLEMFGDPVPNPKGWPVKALGEVLDHLEAGWSANGDARPRAENEYGVLKVSAVTSGIFRPEEHKAISASAIDRELVTPRRGDLLFSRANTRELVAATCLVERNEPRLFLPDKLWRVVPRIDAVTTPYLRFLLAHDRFRSELTKTATGTSGSMLNVSMEKLRGLRGPFPPIDQQKKFAALVWRSLDAKAKHEAAHETTETFFSALVSRAFSASLGDPC